MNKLIVNRDNLIRGLSILEGITGGRHINPVCSSVFFEVRDEKVFLRATNLEDSIETQISVNATDFDGSFLVFGPKLLSFVKELSDDDITMILDDSSSTLSIVSSSPGAKIPLGSVEEFPSFPTVPENGSLVPIPSEVFLEAVEKTAFSTSSEHESRVLYGINFALENDTLRVTSSDGFRFSRYWCTIDNPVGVGWSAIVPKRRAQDVKRILPVLFDKEEEVLIGRSGNHFYLGSDNLSVFSRIIDDDYPKVICILSKRFI
jgi:DNA polymerase-3 subunit beta